MSTVPVTEQTITTALRRLPAEQWPQVLAFIDSLQPPPATTDPADSDRRWTAAELRKLPAAERDAILERQAAAFADEYRNDSELTDFEAFGDEDHYVESPDSETHRCTPVADEEAELLEDVGRIRMPPRAMRSVRAHVVPALKRAPRLGADAEE